MTSLEFHRLGLGAIVVLTLIFGIIPYASGAEENTTTTSVTLAEITTSEALEQSETTSTTLAEAAAEEPSEHEGQQSTRLACSDIDPTWGQLAVTGHPVSGQYTVSDAFRTVQISVLDASSGGKVVNWHSDGPVDAVILRSGQDAATYEYEPPARSDTGLLPPLKDRDGRNLAAVLVCYDPAGAVVGLELSLADSDDPVDVGDQFDYVLSLSTTDPVTDARVTITLAPEVSLVSAPECTVEESEVLCAPPLADQASWQTTITVSADTGGDAISRATLRGLAGGEPVEASAVEVTRIIGPGGHDGGCGDHEDEDECDDGGAALVAACSAIDPNAASEILPGPFANRRYLVEGPGGARIWVTVSEATGQQTLSWESNMPIDAVLARTGRDIADYQYGPLTFSGSGVVGPAGGRSGEPRPIADVALCYAPRKTVDVGLTNPAIPRLQVGVPGTFSVTLSNNGYRQALGVSVVIEPGEGARLHSCGGEKAAEDRCVVGPVAPGATIPVEFELVADSDGEGEVSIEVLSLNESSDAGSDNVLVLSYLVDAANSTQPPPTTTVPGEDGDTTVAAELPFTGAGPGFLWLALLATVLVGAGAGITLSGRDAGSKREPRADHSLG